MKSLDLSQTALIDPEEAKEYTSLDIVEYVEGYMREHGMEPLPQPQSEPPDIAAISENADDLTDHELALYHTRFRAWAGYFGSQLALAKVAHANAERNRKNLYTDLALKLFKEKIPKGEVKDRVHANGFFRNVELEEHKAWCIKVVLEAHFDALDKNTASISRLITLREQEIEKQRIENNVKSRGGGQQKRRPLR